MTLTPLPDNGLGALHKKCAKVSGGLFAKPVAINTLRGGHFVRTLWTDCPGTGRRTHSLSIESVRPLVRVRRGKKRRTATRRRLSPDPIGKSPSLILVFQ